MSPGRYHHSSAVNPQRLGECGNVARQARDHDHEWPAWRVLAPNAKLRALVVPAQPQGGHLKVIFSVGLLNRFLRHARYRTDLLTVPEYSEVAPKSEA